jgi:hypothetical protein
MAELARHAVCQTELELRHLAICLYQLLEHLLILVGSAYRKLMSHHLGYLACITDLIGDQPILCQRRSWRVSSYRIQVWCCNVYVLKPMIKVASGLISSANVINPSVTSYLGWDLSLWPGSAPMIPITWRNRSEIPLTRILTIDCCVW